MSSSNDVSYVQNGSFKYGINSSSNMNILISMHIICLQKYSVQTKNQHILKQLMCFRLKGLILVQVKQNAQKIAFVIIC